jgi:hypothetical protein
MGIKDKLLHLIKQAKANNTVNSIEIGMVDSPFAKMIEEQTKINVEGYVITIDGYGILHALKRHGNEPNENQVSLSEEDFLLIEQIVFEADSIEDVSRYEKNALQFSKLIENEYFTRPSALNA